MAYTRWLSQTTRSGGEYNSPNVTVPSGIDTLRIHLIVVASAFATADKSLTITIEISKDGATSWTHQFTVGWIGGPVPTRPGQTGWYAAVSGLEQYAGNLARVHISQSGNFRWGLDGEIL